MRSRWKLLAQLACLATAVGFAARATAAPAERPALHSVSLGPLPALTETSWILERVDEDGRWKLRTDSSWMSAYVAPNLARASSERAFAVGRYGPSSWFEATRLSWNASACSYERGTPESAEPARALGGSALDPGEFSWQPLSAPARSAEWIGSWLRAALVPEPALLAIEAADECAPWQRPREVTFARFGNERDRFALLTCTGAVTAEAVDRLSSMMRPPGAPRPELPLPVEPQATSGEWVAGVRLVHPRLVWLLSKIAERFPHRSFYIYSGYRRTGHGSLHRLGRAADIAVAGVSSDDLFRYCRTLDDVACGYYPNHPFVHVDVRPYGTPSTLWVDVSLPGEPSAYVDGWPGVVEPGVAVMTGD